MLADLGVSDVTETNAVDRRAICVQLGYLPWCAQPTAGCMWTTEARGHSLAGSL